MVEKLNDKLISEMSKKVKPKRDWRTRAFQLRSNSIQSKTYGLQDEEMLSTQSRTQATESKYSSFSKRSSSVLPPLPGMMSELGESQRNIEVTPRVQRPHSDLQSVYKLDLSAPKPLGKEQSKVERLF